MISLIYGVTLNWPSPPLWLIVCALLGVAAAIHLYITWYRKRQSTKSVRLLLSTLRGLTVAIIAALLIAPIITGLTTHEEQKELVVLVDDSKSMVLTGDSAAIAGRIDDAIDQLRILDEKADLSIHHFGAGLVSDDQQTYSEMTTDIGQAIEQVKERHPVDRLGGIVLLTDGIYNTGQNPEYLRGIERTPVYPIALGDTSLGVDVNVERVLFNKVVYRGDQFELEVDISVEDLDRSSLPISLYDITSGQSRKIDQQDIKISGQKAFKTLTFRVQADEPGVRRYRVVTPRFDEEVNTANNSHDFYVEVIDTKQKILLVARAPHPDLAAIRAAISSRKTIELDLLYAADAKQRPTGYDLIIWHGLPARGHTFQTWISQYEKEKIPSLFVVATTTDLPSFNALQNVLTISSKGNQNTDAAPIYVPAFNYIKLPDQLTSWLNDQVPLRVPFGQYSLKGGMQILAKQSIIDVETNYPLIAMGEARDVKSGVIAGEGIWKWRMENYARSETFEQFDDFIAAIIQYLAVSSDRRRFVTGSAKRLYTERERVTLTAEYYNESYEAVNDSDVNLELTDSAGAVSQYAFSKFGNTYQLDLGRLSPGSYSYKSNTTVHGKTYTSSGRFTVQPLLAEVQQLKANHELLNNLAKVSGGTQYGIDQVGELVETLQQSNALKPVLVNQTSRRSILSLPWLLFGLLASLCLEWFVRKYVGYY